ncbi:MAG: 16S rRNA (cytidine(1402)-2'-O)-methyltransferase [Patescibacteria group bacterium]
MTGTLYIVATPIGNLGDLTLRALDILKSVDIVLAEDTRVTNKLLMHYDIKKTTLSYHQQSPENKKLEILQYLLSGKDAALVTDAGTPGISDPGNELVSFLISANSEISEAWPALPVKIIPIPGPSSLTAILSVCGFDVSTFLFIGFWPKKKTRKLFEKIKNLEEPVVFFESPYRIFKTIDLLIKEFGESKQICVARELTKIHETLYRGSLKEVKEKMLSDTIKGEIVCVLDF